MLWLRVFLGYFVLFFVLGFTAVMTFLLTPGGGLSFAGSGGLVMVTQASNASLLMNVFMLPIALLSTVLAAGVAFNRFAEEKLEQELRARGWHCHNCRNYQKKWLSRAYYCTLTNATVQDLHTCSSHSRYQADLTLQARAQRDAALLPPPGSTPDT
jgi:hypothetical protein